MLLGADKFGAFLNVALPAGIETYFNVVDDGALKEFIGMDVTTHVENPVVNVAVSCLR